MTKKTLFLLTFAALLTACLPAAQSDAEVQARINTAVAQTMEINNLVAVNVQQTMSAMAPAASPTLAVAATPTATFEPIIIVTDTPLPTITPFPPTSLPAAAPTQPKYSCYISTAKPKSGQEMGPGDTFEIKMYVVNSGARPWRAGVDVKFAGGVKLTGPSRVEIPVAMNPGDEYKILLTGTAPANSGRYVMSWAVEGPVCYGSVVIVVK